MKAIAALIFITLISTAYADSFLFVPGVMKDDETVKLVENTGRNMTLVFNESGHTLIMSQYNQGHITNESLEICSDRVWKEIETIKPDYAIGYSAGGVILRHLVEYHHVNISIIMLESVNGGVPLIADLVQGFNPFLKYNQDLWPDSDFMATIKINETKIYPYPEIRGKNSLELYNFSILGFPYQAIRDVFRQLPGAKQLIYPEADHIALATNETIVRREIADLTPILFPTFFKRAIRFP